MSSSTDLDDGDGGRRSRRGLRLLAVAASGQGSGQSEQRKGATARGNATHESSSDANRRVRSYFRLPISAIDARGRMLHHSMQLG